MGTAAVQKAAALTDDIRAMVAATDLGLIGARDRALILLGFAGAFRRSELVGLDVADCGFGKDGLTIMLRGRKRTKMERAARLEYRTGRIPKRVPCASFKNGWSWPG
jgi:integrase